MRGPLNGVDVPTLFATIDAVDGTRELANFQFRATNKWETGTYSRTTIKSFYGAGQDHDHATEFVVDADHPAVLVGEDRAPLPVELVLAALQGLVAPSALPESFAHAWWSAEALRCPQQGGESPGPLLGGEVAVEPREPAGK